MQILENIEEWSSEFEDKWLKHLEQTGEVNWKIYRHPQNADIPAAPAVKLADSRLLFISSAGSYRHTDQEPFDAANPLGDFTIRSFSSETPFTDLSYAHTHYDHSMIETDPEVALPLGHLRKLVTEGTLGEFSPSIISFMGYQPDAARVVEEMIPLVLELVDREQPDAALLAPM
jgi:hypothetical protein